MTQRIQHFKVTELPLDPDANSVYYVYDGSGVTQYVTDADGTALLVGAPVGGPSIGDEFGDATDGSVFFAGADGALSQDNSQFFYDRANRALKLVDKDYVPFAGALDADVKFAVGSNDNVQNNPGVVETSNHFVGAAFDFKIASSGADKWLTGLLTQFRTGGPYTGSNGYIRGHHILVNNRLNTGGAVSNIYGIDVSINMEGNANESVGIQAGSYRGNAVACPKFVGIRAIAANGYSTAEEVTAGEFIARTVSQGALTGLARSVWAKSQVTAGHTVTEARGIALDGWTNGGEIEKSVGIYADDSIDQGTSEKWFILSDSLSPSRFAGNLTAPNVRDRSDVEILRIPDLSKGVVKRVQAAAPATAFFDVLTCPVGKKILVANQTGIFNFSGAATGRTAYLKTVGGVYIRLNQSVTVANGGNAGMIGNVILSAGESLAFNANIGARYSITYYEFDAADAPFGFDVMALDQGAPQMLREVPDGKIYEPIAMVASIIFSASSINSNNGPSVMNDSASASVITTWHAVAGDPFDATTQVASLNCAANAQLNAIGIIPAHQAAGERIWMQASVPSANLFAYAGYWIFDA